MIFPKTPQNEIVVSKTYVSHSRECLYAMTPSGNRRYWKEMHQRDDLLDHEEGEIEYFFI